MNKNQLKKVISNLQTYVDDKIDKLPVSYKEKLLLTILKESIDKSKVDAATDNSPYIINIPVASGFEYVEDMFNNADIVIEYNGKKYISAIFENSSNSIVYGIKSENNIFGFGITKDNSSDIQLVIFKLDTTNITDIKLYMRKKDININDLKIDNSISIGRIGNIGVNSSAIGNGVKALGNFSHAEGSSTTALGINSHVEGRGTIASGDQSHAEGSSTKASGTSSHTEGYDTKASGNYGSHAEGWSTKASGTSSHTEGYNTIATGAYSHAEGSHTTASGYSSHVEGDSTTASSDQSHAEGYFTKASSENQHVQGKFNIEDTANKYAHIVGNGKDNDNRSNAHTLDWEGNGWYSGKLSQEGTPIEDKDLATKKYVDKQQITDTEIDEAFVENGISSEEMYKITYDLRGMAEISSNMNTIYKNAYYCARVRNVNTNIEKPVTITMGGVDITSTALNNKGIIIDSVTGDINIILKGTDRNTSYDPT